jgi:hypothetical protein
MAGEEIKLMRLFFFNKMNGDSAFRSAFGTTNLAARIGKPLADQSSLPPLINIRDLGSARGGLLRPQNSAQDYLWVQRRFLVVAIEQGYEYPDALASLMYGLFKLNQSLAVTGGRIHHCYLEDETNFYTAQYTAKDSKVYSEQGSVWIIAAKAN